MLKHSQGQQCGPNNDTDDGRGNEDSLNVCFFDLHVVTHTYRVKLYSRIVYPR